MIAYDLQCANGHCFEGWFEDQKAYQDQKNHRLIQCPVCNDTAVVRIPSVFAIKASSTAKDETSAERDMAAIGRKIADFVENTFDDVGCDFAKEALKMHYGVVEARNIRGVSTQEEEKIMKQEGVDFFKFPLPARPDSDA